MKVHASFEAGTYIRERGGRLYVWLRPVGSAYGTIHVSTAAPDGATDLVSVDAGGFELFLDPEIERPRRVEITLRRWPWPRLRVRGFAGGDASAGDLSVSWDSGWGGGGGDGGGGNGGGNGGGG